MKEITIKAQVYKVPESWKEVTLKMQLEVDRLALLHPDYPSLATVSGYMGVEVELLKHLHINEFKGLMGHLEFVLMPMKQQVLESFSYKGETYHLLESMLKGEFQDFMTNEGLLEANKGREYQALPSIVAVLAKKTGESLSNYDLEERSRHFQDLPITTANNIYFFFAVIGLLSSQDSPKILSQMDQHIRESISSMLITPKKPVGGGWLTRLQMATLRFYLRYLLKGWKQYYGGYISGTGSQN